MECALRVSDVISGSQDAERSLVVRLDLKKGEAQEGRDKHSIRKFVSDHTRTALEQYPVRVRLVGIDPVLVRFLSVRLGVQKVSFGEWCGGWVATGPVAKPGSGSQPIILKNF